MTNYDEFRIILIKNFAWEPGIDNRYNKDLPP